MILYKPLHGGIVVVVGAIVVVGVTVVVGMIVVVTVAKTVNSTDCTRKSSKSGVPLAITSTM